ncbi:ABC transporter permease [Natranaerobius thermophilus]|uniref:Binding-protein-dependent transport systems inner membrane component n=1 Tax=Natranaerobius thermophilus (strain ATCC BAA-1301 / DSM 18059 / JW/NM-WN-LF) TaxID=457570 RepID=B2A2W8_NATTJ|nr:ABC transporter permease [Natranaerobius thermophilus]ACB86336.1 binding-protein-dependent transport systems inner membrane component [Natranaerobius thermophilus JW/NM-WN-LF]
MAQSTDINNSDHRENGSGIINSLQEKDYILWVRQLLKSKTGTVGLLIVLGVVLLAIFAPYITPHEPDAMNAAERLSPPSFIEGGSGEHILGTDNVGRDIFTRILYGTRISLFVGITSVVVAGIIGVTLGLIAGYFGGIVDNIIMRVVDAFLAIPNILLILVILAVFGPSLWTVIGVLGATNWVVYARMIRGEVLSVKEQEYVKASKTIGTKNTAIIFKHILPNVMSTFIVISTLRVATTIILEASLSFLGLGIQPPQVSWGGMLSDGRDYLATAWWISTFPGIAITITVLGIIFLGDWLRDVLDPKSQNA